MAKNTYIEMFNEQLKKNKKNAEVRALSVLNAYTLTLNDEKIGEDVEQILEFYDWFFEKYGDNEKLMEDIYENWGENGPRMFRIAECILEQIEEQELREFEKGLPISVRSNIKTLHNYILNTGKHKVVTFFYHDEEYEPDCVEIPETVHEGFIQDLKNILMTNILRIVAVGGVIVLRLIGENRDTICSFIAKDCELFKVPLDQLVESYRNNTEKSNRIEIYKEAGCIFR